MIVAITGYTGFIGNNLLRSLLQQGHRVLALGRNSPINLPVLSNCEFINVDLFKDTYSDVIDGADVLFHLAGSGSVSISVNDPFQDIENSICLTTAVLRNIVACKVRPRFVFSSTAAVYGNTSGSECINKLHPVSLYGENKLHCERLVSSISSKYNIESICARIFSVYGPGCSKQLFWDAYKKFLNQDFSFMGSGNELRDFIYIDDVVKILCEFVTKPMSECYSVVDVGRGIPVDIKNAVETFRDICGYSDPIVFTSQARAGDPNELVAHKELMVKDLPSYTSLSDGLSEYYNWLISRNV